MRGQNAIIRMRLAGYKPAFVWLLVLQGQAPTQGFLDAEQTLENTRLPEIHVGIDENPAELDLRPLVGLTVLLQGLDRDRVRGVFARLKFFDPARVVVSGVDFFYDYCAPVTASAEPETPPVTAPATQHQKPATPVTQCETTS